MEKTSRSVHARQRATGGGGATDIFFSVAETRFAIEDGTCSIAESVGERIVVLDIVVGVGRAVRFNQDSPSERQGMVRRCNKPIRNPPA